MSIEPASTPDPPRPKGDRRLVITVLAVVIAGIFVVSALSGPRAAEVPAVAPDPTVTVASTKPWPTVPTACGGQLELPLVSDQRPPAQASGVKLIVGGKLRILDVDSGDLTLAKGLQMNPAQVITDLATVGTETFALVSTCRLAPGTVIRVDADGAVLDQSTTRVDALLPGGDHIWGITYASSNGTDTVQLDPLDGAPVVTVPDGLFPIGAFGQIIVCVQDVPDLAGPGADLVIFTPATGEVSKPIGRTGTSQIGARFALTGAGMVLWTNEICQSTEPCRFYRYDLETGASTVREYDLPKGRYFRATTLSPDGTKLAGQLNRDDLDRRFVSSAGLPSDVAVLDLRTGAMSVVPGIELSSQTTAALAFSTDSTWLTVGVNKGSSNVFCLWKPGMPTPFVSSGRVPAGTPYAPPMVVLPGGG